MKHLGKISVVQDWTAGGAMRDCSRIGLGFADAKTDKMNGMWRVFQDYILQKKNELRA